MSEEEFQQQCQAWEACANQYYNTNNRYLFTEDQIEGESRGYADDATWILTSSFVIFTMQSGFGMLEAGSCSPGFEVNIMMKNIVDVVFTALTYYLVGYGISFGRPSTPFMGYPHPADGGYEEVDSGLLYSRYIFQLSFAATSTTIVSGCVAMRLKFFVYMLYSLIAVIFYAFVAHWVFDPSGWLYQMGARDFAGGAPVHLFGGINGLVATLFLGPRTGRYDGTRPISDFFPSNPATQCLGLLALWWGWIGFNCGSSFGITDDRWVVAIRCAVTTINATVGGGITAIIYSLWRTKWKLVIPDHVINGILGSLVAITPGCAYTHTFDAFPIGAIGALVGVGFNTLICHWKIDDPVGAIGVHAGSACWGLLAVGLFADSQLPGNIDIQDGLFRGGGFNLLGLQLLAIVATIGWSLMWSIVFFYIVGISLSRNYRDPRKGLRVDPEEEERGADWVLHGVIDHHVKADYTKNDDDDSFFDEDERPVNLINKSDMYTRPNLRGQHMIPDNSRGDGEDNEEASRPSDPFSEHKHVPNFSDTLPIEPIDEETTPKRTSMTSDVSAKREQDDYFEAENGDKVLGQGLQNGISNNNNRRQSRRYSGIGLLSSSITSTTSSAKRRQRQMRGSLTRTKSQVMDERKLQIHR